jgi:hypothetical protein
MSMLSQPQKVRVKVEILVNLFHNWEGHKFFFGGAPSPPLISSCVCHWLPLHSGDDRGDGVLASGGKGALACDREKGADEVEFPWWRNGVGRKIELEGERSNEW